MKIIFEAYQTPHIIISIRKNLNIDSLHYESQISFSRHGNKSLTLSRIYS